MDGPAEGRTFEVPLTCAGRPSTDWSVEAGDQRAIYAYAWDGSQDGLTFHYRYVRQETNPIPLPPRLPWVA